MKTIKLNDEAKIPVLGLGTWQMKGDEAVKAIEDAIEIGYRHIDTAEYYGNHREVGEALKKSGIKRNEVFITTKVPPHKLKKNTVLESAKRYCDELMVDYLDLLLVHWPNPLIRFEDPLEAFEQLLDEGLIRSYGVSNYGVRVVEKALKKNFSVRVNQVEFHPEHNSKELKEYCDANSVIVTAYTPLDKGNALKLEFIKRLAAKYAKPASQVVLNWEIGKGMVTIPKAESHEHLLENFKALEWELDPQDIRKIDEL